MGSTSQRMILGDRISSIGLVVNKGITIPEVTLTLDLTNFTGRLEVGISIEKADEDMDTIILETQTTEGFNATRTFRWYLSENDMLQFEDIRPYSPSIFLNWDGLVL